MQPTINEEDVISMLSVDFAILNFISAHCRASFSDSLGTGWRIIWNTHGGNAAHDDMPACRIDRMRELIQKKTRIFADMTFAVKFIMGLYQSRTEKIKNASDITIQRCDKILKNFIVWLPFSQADGSQMQMQSEMIFWGL